jgi:hypothetical protein
MPVASAALQKNGDALAYDCHILLQGAHIAFQDADVSLYRSKSAPSQASAAFSEFAGIRASTGRAASCFLSPIRLTLAVTAEAVELTQSGMYGTSERVTPGGAALFPPAGPPPVRVFFGPRTKWGSPAAGPAAVSVNSTALEH